MEAATAHRHQENEWVPIPHCTYDTVWLQTSEEDPDILDPIPVELDLLEKARKHVNQYSYREVANS